MKNAKLMVLILMISFFLNFVWEFLQSPFYDCFKNSLADNYNHYLLAIVWDSLYTILIYLLVSLSNKNYNWIQNPMKKNDILLSIMTWLMLAIFIECKWAYILWKWNYSPLMPTIYWIWMVPLLQMMILPILSFKIANIFNINKQAGQLK